MQVKQGIYVIGLLITLMASSVLYAQNDSKANETKNPSPRLNPVVQSIPVPLRPDILIEKYADIEANAVRLLIHPISGDFYYTTFEGGVFQITNKNGLLISEKILTVEDHGINKLQGAVFAGSDLFLCGNTTENNNRGTRGRLVRFSIVPNSSPRMTVVFNTEPYGLNATTWDHGWNALVLSPDEQYIFITSGSRTGHGEIQDDKGVYPNARDNALTTKIFRIPVKAENLLLPNDINKLKADAYLYAEGIRNAYDMAFDPENNLFAVVNSSDYDHAEDMFWVRQGRHYGFPWIMGGIENPQQYPDFMPDPKKDPFLPATSHGMLMKYFRNDPDFPKIPEGLKFTPGVQNLGPDANEYRGHSGKILDGDNTGVTISTFTAHSSPLGLVFDTKRVLSNEFRGDGFVLRNTLGAKSSLMKPFTEQGRDLLHLDMTYDKGSDNYFVKTTRIVDSFNNPTDAVLLGNSLYIIEYDARAGSIWKVTLPAGSKKVKRVKKKI
ncbi:MAG: PQQ-dependent sugar dehydrogenase [Daejeonella sp.]|uniref:PQQ-dependent sugar dehydrogenase n=1 Tax=Daejeonella sp. TaxID=2805397 RepID=UPI0027372D36|nr:PQQ-dependent sugar dehydrogenase [Daejeonella sp.]MDP3468086.1 PQQ-dependent sugar dehydrogenase [Daejeonella sp.]